MYWGIPPEINAFRLTMMGAGPAAHTPQIAALQAASTVHLEQGVQQQITAAATSVGFQGAGGTAMMAAALPQAAQMQVAAAHAQAAVGTISSGVGGYCSAVAATQPHPVVIANRIREATLESTNILGFNAVPIAETNAEYGAFWAQNATAMMGYLANTTALLGALSVPLTVLPDASNPAGPLAAVAAALGGEGVDVGIQALGSGLSGTTQAVSSAASVAGEVGGVAGATAAQTASSAKPAGQSLGAQTPAGMPGNAPADGQADQFMQQGMSTMMSAPIQAISAAQQPLSSAGQLPSMLGGQFGSLLNPLSSLAGGMGGGPGGGGLGAPPLSAAGAPWNGLSGANGGFAGGGSTVTAALTRPSAGGIGGPVGLPGAWWANADSESAATKPGAGVRGGAPGAPAAMGSGMYPMGAAAGRGRQQDQHAEVAEADHTIALPDMGFQAPVVTDEGVVYTGAQGG